VFEAEIRVKSTHLIKLCFKTRKKERKYGNIRYFDINMYLKDILDIEFTGSKCELMPHESLKSLTVSDAYR